MTKEKMITIKHAYIKLDLFKPYLNMIESAINEGHLLTAYKYIQNIKEWVEEIRKPLYSALSEKQKQELIDGWDPDTSEGGYIEIPFKPFKGKKDVGK